MFGAWIVANLGVISGIPQFDPSFVILAMIASVEAIFLSTFVLISQNRMAHQALAKTSGGSRARMLRSRTWWGTMSADSVLPS
jgi:uncharacterized membrane protein